MSWRGLRVVVSLGVFAAVCVACFDTNLVNNPSFDLWCGSNLCSWQTDAGTVERVATWHTKDYGVSLVGSTAQISQRSEADPVKCIRFDMIADVDPDARARLALDFNDDGSIEFDELIPAVSWRSVQFDVKAPVDYDGLRIILRKESAGKVVLAQVRATDDSSGSCGGEPLKLADGSRCRVDAACDSNACIDGSCRACARASSWQAVTDETSPLFNQYGPACVQGDGCHIDAHCAPGLTCVAGKCQSCASGGRCPAFTPCDVSGQCAIGACVPRFAPSQVHEVASCLGCASGAECGQEASGCDTRGCEVCSAEPLGRHCAECTSDADCGAGACTYGICSSCRVDADCGAGLRCRFEDMFDAGPRRCTSRSPGKLPRGALCEADAECADGLRCDAPAAEPRRCGVACETDPGICGASGVCTRPGLDEVDNLIFRPQQLLPAFETVAGRVASCFPRVLSDAADPSCELHAQCYVGLCCDGQCTGLLDAVENRHGECVFTRSSQR